MVGEFSQFIMNNLDNA